MTTVPTPDQTTAEAAFVPPRYPEPDFSVCGTPLIELIGSDSLHECVERAAIKALESPTVGIAVCLFVGEALKGEFESWVRRQRVFLAAWRSNQPDRTGTLKLRTRTIVRPNENIATAAFVSFMPAKVRVPA